MQVGDVVPVIASHAVEAAITAFAWVLAWGIRAQIKALESSIRSLRQEMGTELSKAELRFYQRINGSYVSKESQRDISSRVDRIENRVESLERKTTGKRD